MEKFKIKLNPEGKNPAEMMGLNEEQLDTLMGKILKGMEKAPDNTDNPTLETIKVVLGAGLTKDEAIALAATQLIILMQVEQHPLGSFVYQTMR